MSDNDWRCLDPSAAGRALLTSRYLAKGVALDIPVAPAQGARTGDVGYLAEFILGGAFDELLL